MASNDIDSTPLRATTDSSLRPQTLLLHTYEVEQLLASGGMGEVYSARHTELGTRHAIKVIKPALIGGLLGTDVLELFRREAAILRGIRNDAVIGYEGFFRDEQKNFYLVMEYADGPSLAKILTQRALSLKEVYLLRDRLCKGLAAVHEKGVVHRDISPDNVILPGGDVNAAKLIDFGIAKLNDPGRVTIIGSAFVGKLRYAAPEQLGLFGGTVSPATDIYSLGLVLAAATLGEPFDMGDSVQKVLEARQKLPDLQAVPAVLRPQLIAMLQPNPADRPQQTMELLQRWPLPPTLSPANIVTEFTPRPPEVGSRFRNHQLHLLVLLKSLLLHKYLGFRNHQLHLLVLGVGILLTAVFSFFWLLGIKPPAAPVVVSIPEPTPSGMATNAGQPLAPPVAPEVNLAPPAKPEVKEVPHTTALGVTNNIGQPPASPVAPEVDLAPPAKPEVKELPDTTAPGVASIDRQPPTPPPAELDVPKIAPILKKKPPAATGGPQSPPTTPETRRAASERGQQTLSNSRDEGLKRRRCGDILARVTLGESLSNEDRTFLTRECR